MSDCSGRGECLLQCSCGCFDDEDCEIPSAVCSCGHRDHPTHIGGTGFDNVYCVNDCTNNCQLVECHNYRMCAQKRPQWLLDCDGGMCKCCAILVGKIKFLEVKGDCPVCLENKDMVEISCGKHTVCLECWKDWSEKSNQFPLTCPLCRESIWKWKRR
jgi:hypothetical protein